MAKYSKRIVKKICDLIESDSYTIPEICQSVGIVESTYHEWKLKHSEFSEALKKAQETRTAYFVAEAKKSLLKKIQGYSVDETKTVFVNSNKEVKEGEKPEAKIKEKTITKKYYQPDTTAIIFMLTNGEPENFQNKQSSELSGKGGIPLNGTVVITIPDNGRDSKKD